MGDVAEAEAGGSDRTWRRARWDVTMLRPLPTSRAHIMSTVTATFQESFEPWVVVKLTGMCTYIHYSLYKNAEHQAPFTPSSSAIIIAAFSPTTSAVLHVLAPTLKGAMESWSSISSGEDRETSS